MPQFLLLVSVLVILQNVIATLALAKTVHVVQAVSVIRVCVKTAIANIKNYK